MSDIADDSPLKRTSNFMEFPVSPSTAITEDYFHTLGPRSIRRGWAVIPQERTVKRLPGKHLGEVIKWGLYQDVAPPVSLVDEWAEYHFNTNVAVILGKPSGYVWALDIDVTDRILSQSIERLAYQHLGHTTFRRLGNRPKQALFYRASGDDDLPKSRAYQLMEADGSKESGHLLEVKAAKSVMTLYGRHWKTLGDFTWTDYGQPGLNSVLDVPLVTSEQFENFMSAVQELRAFKRPRPKGGEAAVAEHEYDAAAPSEHLTNGNPLIFDTGEWVVEDNLVVKGREAYLRALTLAWVRENNGAAATDAGRAEIHRGCRDDFHRTARVDGKWVSGLERDLTDKLERLYAKVADRDPVVIKRARSRPLRVVAAPTTEMADPVSPEAAPAKPRPTLLEKAIKNVQSLISGLSRLTTYGDRPDRSTAWLSAIRRPTTGKMRAVLDGEASATIPAELVIPATAEIQRERVMRETRGVIREFFEAAMDGAGLTWLVKAPPGSGKTWNVVDALADMKTSDPKPMFFMLPTYANIDEQMADALARGLRAIKWEGKARTGTHDTDGNGCIKALQIKKLDRAEKSTANICGVVREGGNPSNPEDYTSLCPLRFGTDGRPPCRYWQNMNAIPTADVVFGVHQYMTVATPAFFKQFSTVIVDESIRGQLNKTASMPASALLAPRSLAYMTKEEMAGEHDLLLERLDINRIILAAMMAKEDPAKWINEAPDVTDAAKRPAEIAYRKIAIRSAISVCSRTRDAVEITPDTSDAAIDEACKFATRQFIREEAKFLRLIEERSIALVPQTTNEGLQDPDAPVPVTKPIKGKTDRRLHYYRGENGSIGKISISWTAESNFQDRNLLLLDASADAGLLETDLARGDIEVREIKAVPRLRTVYVDGPSFSKSSMLPHEKDTPEKRLAKVQMLNDLRISLTGIAAMHPGGVVACATLAVRRLIRTGWTPPANLRFMHYGATKGLNWAKGYSAAVAIGCLNPSTEQVDAMSAPYLYDKEDPEPMVDPAGEHFEDGDLAPLMIERLVEFRMRNGAILSLPQREPLGDIARRVYEQVRREDFVQFMGRTRPVLRDEVVPLYVLGSYLPDGIVIDEVIAFQDLVKFGGPLETARRDGTPLLTKCDINDEEAIEKSAALLDLISRTDAIKKNLVEVDTPEGLRVIPASSTAAIRTMLNDGGDIVYEPDMKPIIMPADYSRRADMEFEAWEAEVTDRMSKTARLLGWQPVDMKRNRCWSHPTEFGGRPIEWMVLVQYLAWIYLPLPEEGIELYAEQLEELEELEAMNA